MYLLIPRISPAGRSQSPEMGKWRKGNESRDMKEEQEDRTWLLERPWERREAGAHGGFRFLTQATRERE